MTPEQEATLKAVFELQAATRKHVQDCLFITRSAASARLLDLLDLGYVTRSDRTDGKTRTSHWYEITFQGIQMLWRQLEGRRVQVLQDGRLHAALTDAYRKGKSPAAQGDEALSEAV